MIVQSTAGTDANELKSRKKKHNGKAYDKEFKIAAVKLVTDQGYGPKEAALSLGVKPSTLSYWVKIYGRAQTTFKSEVAEIARKNRDEIPPELSNVARDGLCMFSCARKKRS